MSLSWCKNIQYLITIYFVGIILGLMSSSFLLLSSRRFSHCILRSSSDTQSLEEYNSWRFVTIKMQNHTQTKPETIHLISKAIDLHVCYALKCVFFQVNTPQQLQNCPYQDNIFSHYQNCPFQDDALQRLQNYFSG